MLRTHVKCEGCGVRVNKWYDLGNEGTFCPICYCLWFPELADEEDKRIAEEFEENGG
jgi:hypothetical protein